MELVALAVPWLLLMLIITAIGLLVFKRKKLSSGLMALVIVGNFYFETFSHNLINPLKGDNRHTIRVLSFNCNLSNKHDNIEEKRLKVKKFINEQDADVVFLTENFITENDSLWLMLQVDYPYRVQNKNSVGNTLYSKHPILTDTVYKEKGKGFGINCCQVYVFGKMIDIIGVHLSSNNYNEFNVYMTPDNVENSEQAKSYLHNILKASKHREKEASLIVNIIDSIKVANKSFQTIVMGDFNDVCGSPSIKILEKAGLKNAWCEGGIGYGATIFHPLPYRIDHILYNDRLTLKSVKKIDAQLSDHDALAAEFILTTY